MSQSGATGRDRKRLKQFGHHLIGYFALMIVIVPLNLWLTPELAWFVWPMIGWSPVLTLHAAYAMGLFDVFRGQGDAERSAPAAIGRQEDHV
ncbi:MAG: 2TM domain-containing protein [Magnetovibrionaceae bacterium]